MKKSLSSLSRAAVSRSVLLGLCVGLASGCLGSFEEPAIRFEGVRLGSIGLTGGLFYAQLSVTNPNDFGLETRSLTYDLEVAADSENEPEWVRLAEGTLDEPIVVGANDSTRLEVPVEFRFGGLTGIARAMMERGLVDYRVSGVVDVTEPVTRSVPYRRMGQVSFDAIR